MKAWHARDRGGGRETPAADAALDPARDERVDRPVRCARCGHALTATAHKIDVDGAHAHTFVNPSGVVFDIVCYAAAAGALVDGEPESFTSWFPGTAWQYARCGACAEQVGWAYCDLADEAQRARPRRFFGLIVDCIIVP